MSIPEKFKNKEAEFRAMTHKWIEKRDSEFRTLEKTQVAQQSKPIRHPKGEEHQRGSREFFWSDAIWCGDQSLDSLEEFFELSPDENDEIQEGTGDEDSVADWAMKIFNEEFVQVCPDLAHVLEG